MDNNPSADDVYRYAEALKSSGEYEKAQEQMKKYAEMNSNDERAKSHLSDEDYFAELREDKGRFQVTLLEGNTERSDFSPSFYGDKVVFVSARAEGVSIKRRFAWNNAPFLDLYVSSVAEDGSLSKATNFSEDINSAMHEGPLTFTNNNNTVYFTRNNFIQGKAVKSAEDIINLNIYYSTKSETGWSAPEAFAFNNDEYSVGHPSISKDGKTMYFSSDMPGGYGGADIYRTTLKNDGSWSEPVNMGSSINTESDELFPFIHEDGTLYFASEGLLGLGGLDVFKARSKNGLFMTPENLGAPVNTEKDDFGFILSEDQSSGYLSSNRKGGKGDDDIYHFLMEKELHLFLAGKVINAADGEDLEGAMVRLKDASGNVVEESTMGEDASFSFELDKTQCGYSVEAFNGQYWTTFASEKTACDITEGTIDLGDIPLEQMRWGAEGTIKDKYTGAGLDGFRIILTDLTGGGSSTTTTKEDGFASFPLEEGMNYEIRFERAGYFAKTAVFTTYDMPPGIVEIEKLTGLIMEFEPLEVGKEVKIDNIYYDYDKSYIRSDAAVELDKIVKLLNDNPTIKIEMGSHTDARGSDSYNLKLSKRRAKAAMEYLIKKGIAPARLTWKGYGETTLVNDCGNGVECADEIHEENRRTTFKVLEL